MSLLSYLSTEAIAYQGGDKLLKPCAEVFKRLVDDKSERYNPKNYEELSAIVTSITGIMSRIEIFDSSLLQGAAVAQINHKPSLNPLNQGALKKLEKLDSYNLTPEQIVNGKIDYANGKVSGVFSEIPHVISINLRLFDLFTDEYELAAIYIHEVGHIFTMLAFMGEALITNATMAYVLGQYDETATEERKLKICKTALKAAGMDDNIKEADIGKVTEVVVNSGNTRLQKRINSKYYEHQLPEIIADQFAARHGASSYLVKAVGRLERDKGFILARTGFDTPVIGILSNLLDFVMTPYRMAAAMPGTSIAIPLLTQLGIRVGIGSASLLLTDPLTKSYPNPEERIARLRREVVAVLKDPKASRVVKDAAIKDLEIIDKEISKIHNFGSILNKVSEWVNNAFTGRSNSIKHQNAIEELSINRLYELAAHLKR